MTSSNSKSKQSKPATSNASKYVLWGVVAVIVAVVAFLVLKPAGGGTQNVDSAGVTAAQKAGAQVIDVRSAGEYEMGHIPGAVNVPVDTIQQAAANWDRNATYVIYCATGARSAEAVQILQGMGFKNLKHFNTGIQSWTGQLEQSSQQSSTKIKTNGKPVFIEFYTDS